MSAPPECQPTSKNWSDIAKTPKLSPEEDFLILVEQGDVNNVKQFLKQLSKDGLHDFPVNTVDYKNADAMSVAVDAGNWEMVRYLMTVMTTSKTAVLLKAVHKGDVDLVVRLCTDLGADEAVESEGGFQQKMSPLMLAAIKGHHEIIAFFLSRGHTLHAPHPPACCCNEFCLPGHETSDKLDLAQHTFSLYSALSNPEYFVHVAGDPILYAFKIHKRLVALSNIEQPFKLKYEQLARNVRLFTANLVAECANAKEIEIVLNKSSQQEDSLPGEVYPRLLLAMEYNQKEFVTHPKIQVFLRDRFYGTFTDWKYYSDISKLFYPFIRLFTFPSALFSIVLYPSSSEAKFYGSPLNRMLHSVVFYLVFLVALFFEGIRDKPHELKLKMSSIWTVVILMYFCSMTAVVAYQIFHLRPGRFFHNGWNVFDVVMLTMLGFYLAFTGVSTVRVAPCVALDRKYWAGADPQLVADGFLVVASVLAYLKLMFFLQANMVMGPMQVALGEIIKACTRYSSFIVVILLAYATAFSRFYAYYEGMTYRDPVSSDVSRQEPSFVNWMSSFKTFFWAMFAQSDPAVADVVVENLNGTSNCSSNEHLLTEFFGYIGLGTFSILVVMVIVNMLIAAISETFINILNDVHKSWLFVRTEMYIYFMNYPVLPPPFTLIPNLFRIRDLLEKCDLEQVRTQKGYSFRKEYYGLMGILVSRYFRTMRRQKDRLEIQNRSLPEDLVEKRIWSACRSSSVQRN